MCAPPPLPLAPRFSPYSSAVFGGGRGCFQHTASRKERRKQQKQQTEEAIDAIERTEGVAVAGREKQEASGTLQQQGASTAMSREERKMAQIIASIERMEQRKSSVRADSNGESDGNTSSSAVSSGSRVLPIQRMNSTEIHAQVQKSTRLGAKGKKLKPLSTSHGGVKVKSSKKAKTLQELIVRKSEVVECKLTPKKRWILAWNEQLSTAEKTNKIESKVSSELEQEPPREKISLEQVLNAPEQVEQKVSKEPKCTRPAIIDEPVKEEGEDGEIEDEEGAVTTMTESEGISLLLSPSADGQKESSISPVAAMKETLKDIPVSRVAVDKKEVQKGNATKVKDPEKISSPVMPSEPNRQRELSSVAVSSDSDDSKKSAAKKLASTTSANSSAGLRVKTPQVTESSHLSPPLDRNSPAPAASISPSSKTKEAESANAEASLPSTEKTPLSGASPKKDEVKTNSIPSITRKDSTESLNSRRDETRSRKRSLERKESEPLTEEEKRRAERRRNRKSNWDVGDPRLGSRNADKHAGRSPSSDGNHPSSRFPSGRPAWRHSNSMDATYMNSSKPSFQNGSSHRASFSGGSSSSRRGFYSSNSLPLDRSRSAGRPASRYHYNNSYR
ncbi:hypothetical protein FI667_g9543, partial [Globisporangium splendens]